MQVRRDLAFLRLLRAEAALGMYCVQHREAWNYVTGSYAVMHNLGEEQSDLIE